MADLAVKGFNGGSRSRNAHNIGRYESGLANSSTIEYISAVSISHAKCGYLLLQINIHVLIPYWM